MTDPRFRAGFAELAPLGLTFDAWLFHHQIPLLTDLARSFPDTTIVLDHVGAPLGVGPYANRRAEVFSMYLREGTHVFAYTARAATPGTFLAAPAKAEEMYSPETFGRSVGQTVVIE